MIVIFVLRHLQTIGRDGKKNTKVDDELLWGIDGNVLCSAVFYADDERRLRGCSRNSSRGALTGDFDSD